MTETAQDPNGSTTPFPNSSNPRTARFPRDAARNAKRLSRFRPSPSIDNLFSNIQLRDQIDIPSRIVLADIIQQRPSLADHPKQAAPARIVAIRRSHVFRHSVDSFCQQRDLNVRRSAVALMRSELSQNFRFSFFRNSHVQPTHILLAKTGRTFRYPMATRFLSRARILAAFSLLATPLGMAPSPISNLCRNSWPEKRLH